MNSLFYSNFLKPLKHFFEFSLLFFSILVWTVCTRVPQKKSLKELAMIYKNTYTLLDSPSHRFEQEIKYFELADSAKIPPKNAVLFIGSSSIRLWKSLAQDMYPIPVINRGFGGATTSEVIQYIDKIVLPYLPKLIVFYAGENDIANDYIPATAPFGAFVRFVEQIEKELPETKISIYFYEALSE